MERGYSAGLDVGGSSIKWMVTRDGEFLKNGSEPLGSRGVKEVVDSVVLTIKVMERETGMKVERAGIGVPGFIGQPRGVVHRSPNFPEWREVDLLERLKERTGIAIFLENDANCALLGEYWKGAGRGAMNQCLLTLGTGIGGGIMVNGRVLRGARGYASEVGHIIIREGGERCGCGGRGCLEAYASGTALIRDVKRLFQQGKGNGIRGVWMREGDGSELSVKNVTDSAREGDREAGELVAKMGRSLGCGISTLVNLYNPERVIISGGIAASFDLLIPHILEGIEEYAISPSKDDVDVRKGEIPLLSGCAGAAFVAMMGGDERLFL